jgi:LmbE family N-acetylglucosaminyl deacetylase
MSSDAIIAARPHFHREGDDLYFFLSGRVFHHLKPEEAEIWKKLQSGRVAAADLPDAAAVQSMVEAGVAERIIPVEVPDRRQILVIEPHCDDAALSIGATMWKMRTEAEFHLVTMASRSNYSTAFQLHRDRFDREHITAMRTAEGELFTEHLGGHYRCAGMSEATLRYDDSDWNLDFFEAHEVPVAIAGNRRAPSAILDSWIEYIKRLLEERSFEEIWIPLGAGTHSDHDLTRNAALNALIDERPPGVIRLYEDVPYGAHFPEHSDRIVRALSEVGAKLQPWYQDVTEEFPAKMSLLSIFASQFKVPSIAEGVERSASKIDTSKKIERMWTLEALPGHVPGDDLWIGAPGVSKASQGLSDFLAGADRAGRVAIFLIGASGRWAQDFRTLSSIFPAAKFVVYAGPRVSTELHAVQDARLELHCLDGKALSWLKAAVREIATSHRLIIAADALGKARSLSLLWPLGRKLICTDMDHVMQALAGRQAAVPGSDDAKQHPQ